MKNTLLLFACLLFGCGQNSNTLQQALPVIDLVSGLEQGAEIKLSEYASSIEYIPLDTTMSILAGDLKRFNFRKEGEFYYYGCPDNKTCLVFQENGAYIGNIGQQGKAGNEFYTILDLEIDPKSNNLLIYDGNKLQVYSCNGEHRKTIRLDSIRIADNIHIRDFNLLDGYICLHITHQTSDTPGVMFLNSNGEKVYTHLPQQAPERQTEFQTAEGIRYRKRTALNSYLFNKQLTILNPETDTLFAYTAQLNRTSRYVLNFGKYKLLPNKSNQAQSVTLNPNIAYESENLLIFTLLTNKNKFNHSRPGLSYLVYDKKTKITRTIPHQKGKNTAGFQNDLDNGAPFLPDGICGTQLYQIINASQFIENSNLHNSSPMRKTATHLTENSNPVLVVVTLK